MRLPYLPGKSFEQKEQERGEAGVRESRPKGFWFLSRSLPGRATFLNQADIILNAPVIGFFNVIREITGRQFTHASVIAHAIAAKTFSAARVGTIAAVFISVCFTVHDQACAGFSGKPEVDRWPQGPLSIPNRSGRPVWAAGLTDQ
jgi:uncharacterized membrane protein